MLQLGDLGHARCPRGGIPEVWAGEWISLGRHGWTILGTFLEPITLEEALSRLSESARGQAEFIEITTVVLRLRDRGVLAPVGDGASVGWECTSVFGAIPVFKTRSISPAEQTSKLPPRAATSSIITGWPFGLTA